MYLQKLKSNALLLHRRAVLLEDWHSEISIPVHPSHYRFEHSKPLYGDLKQQKQINVDQGRPRQTKADQGRPKQTKAAVAKPAVLAQQQIKTLRILHWSS